MEKQHKEALRQIYRYIRFPGCKFSGSFHRSEEIYISRWAAMEISRAIVSHLDQPVNVTIGEFYGQMVRCMQLSRQEKQKQLFRLAADAAEEISAMI